MRRFKAPIRPFRVAYDSAGQWPRYVSIAERRSIGVRHAAHLTKSGRVLRPVAPRARSRVLAATFWGRAWCDNLTAYASLVNRLERGRSYLRGGLVIDLQIEPGEVTALVSGSDVYEVHVQIAPMPAPRWRKVVKACAGKIDSVVELLAGRIDESVMAHVCRQGQGLFPSPDEIRYACTCPDGAGGGWLCKHVAATLYGVGVRLDEDPELLFALRRVAHAELLASAAAGLTRATPSPRGARPTVAADRLAAVFGIELEQGSPKRPSRSARPTAPARPVRRAVPSRSHRESPR
jgi:uncharacterized Zn finger protein